MKEKELANCTFVKTILMLVIVLYHSIIFWTGTWVDFDPVFPSKLLGIAAQWMNTIHIYAFTLVSGYIFRYVKHEKGRYARFLPFVWNKAKRLIIPYVFVSVLWAIPIGTWMFDWKFADVYSRYILGTFPNQLWFVLMLFWVFLLFWVLSDFMEMHPLFSVILIAGCYGFGMLIGRYVPNFYRFQDAFRYVLYFWIGFMFRKCGTERLRKIPFWLWLSADLLLYGISLYLPTGEGLVSLLLHKGMTELVCTAGACMAFFGLQKAADRVAWSEKGWFSLLSKHSMTIYLLHQQIIYIVLVLLNGRIGPYLHAGINFLISLSISLALAILLNQTRWTRVCIGEK